MCGLSGYLLKSSVEKSSAIILEMLSLQKHRGPDDSGIVGISMRAKELEEVITERENTFVIQPDLVFGFNRLSILDTSPNGHQPMIHQASKVCLMLNGEVYNAFDYKQELIRKGFSFKGHSDTEVVLYLYLAYGLEEMLRRLNGMFAIVIFDGRTQELFLIRDRMGIKPLYVLKEAHRLAFASEMKSFKALPGFQFELDKSKLSTFLLYRNCINETLFKNIVNITPGTFWRVQANGTYSTHVYYDLRNEGGEPSMKPQEELTAALRAAVTRQMISDVKLGCQLSGGVDSSMVTAYAAENLPQGALETVSIVFDEADFSEKPYIDHVARQYGLISHQFTLSAQAYLDLLDDAIWHFEQPLNHPNTIGIKLLSREARKHVTVLLSGEGADESLAGYSRFLPLNDQLFNATNFKKLIKNSGRLFDFMRLMQAPDMRYLLQTAYGGIATAHNLYADFSIDAAMASRLSVWSSIDAPLPGKKRVYELLSYLPDLLMRQDKMSMAHSIENRVPFLDNQMVQAALNLPDSLLVKQHKGKWEGKWLLKEVCARTFDEAFAYRSKMGFGIPLKSFFGSPVFQKRWGEELLPSIKKRAIFKSDSLARWMQMPSEMNTEQLDAVWLMIGFEIWAKQYLD